MKYFNISPDQRTISNPLSLVSLLPSLNLKRNFMTLHDTFKANHLDITMHYHCVTNVTWHPAWHGAVCHTDTECHISLETGDGTDSSAVVNNVGAVLNIEGWAGYCVINLSASIFSERQSLVVITNYMPRIIKHSSNILFIVRNWRWNIYSNACCINI